MYTGQELQIAIDIADDIFTIVQRNFPDIKCTRVGSSVNALATNWFEGILIGNSDPYDIRVYVSFNYAIKAALCKGGSGHEKYFNISNPDMYRDIIIFIENNLSNI